MSSDHDDLKRLREALAALDAVSVRSLEIEQERDRALAAIGRMYRRIESKIAASPQFREENARFEGVADVNSSGKYAGLSISEAATKYLKELGTQAPVKDMLEALAAGGYVTTAEHPASALTTALERRETNYKDITKVANAVWVHRDHITPKIKAALEHKARTARGMQQRKARGLRIGAPRRFDKDKQDEVVRRIAAGDRIKTIAKSMGISEMTIRRQFKRDDIEAIRRSAQEQQPDHTVEDKRMPTLRVVGEG